MSKATSRLSTRGQWCCWPAGGRGVKDFCPRVSHCLGLPRPLWGPGRMLGSELQFPPCRIRPALLSPALDLNLFLHLQKRRETLAVSLYVGVSWFQPGEETHQGVSILSTGTSDQGSGLFSSLVFKALTFLQGFLQRALLLLFRNNPGTR